MLYCVKCKKNKESTDPKFSKTKINKILLSSKCAVCNSKKSRFAKEQEATRLLTQLGTRTTLTKIYHY